MIDGDAPPAAGWVSEFLSHLEDVRGFTAGTVKTYRMALQDFQVRMGEIDHTGLSPRDLDRYAGRLALAGLAENTRRSRLSALRSYFEFGFTRGFRSDNPARDVHPPRLREVERIPTFTTNEIERIIFRFRPLPPRRGKREPDLLFSRRLRIHNLALTRDTAVLAVVYQLGLRASDVGLLERRDYTVENRVPVVILRRGKWARKPSAFRLDRRVSEALEAYLRELERAGVRYVALFPPLAYRKVESDRGIGRNEIAAILQRRIKAAEIQAGARKLTPHTMRYTIATHLHERGIRPEEIRFLLRHKSVATTWRYIQLGSAASIQKRTIHALYWNRPAGRSGLTSLEQLAGEESEFAKEASRQGLPRDASAKNAKEVPR